MMTREFIISPYFSNNTNLVANFCKCCYLKEDTIIITSINITFLKNHDPKQYRNFKCRWPMEISDVDEQNTKYQSAKLKAFSHQSILKSITSVNNFFYKTLMTLRFYNNIKLLKITERRIMGKYKRFNKIYLSKRNSNHNKKGLQNVKKGHNSDRINNLKVDVNKTVENEDKQEMERSYSQLTSMKKDAEIDGKELQQSSKRIDKTQTYSTEIIKRKISLAKCSEIEPNINSSGTKSSVSTSKWIPPLSPHNLIEERFYNDPWALLVVTIFLNRTSCNLASPYMDEFFQNFTGPYEVLKTEISELEPYFYKIGLVKTRATQIWKMSYDFVHKDWKSAKELYGVGKYAEDAYRMFHLGDFSIRPTDRYLKIYKAWYEMTRRKTELGEFLTNSQVYLEDYYVTSDYDEDRSQDSQDEGVN